MNKKIQNLAETAKKSIPHGLGTDKWIETYNEKFAELIVRECAQDFDNTYMSGGKTMGAYIREKFGVDL
jgi:uncharacterized protein YgbK (DUF1537 family)